jgi:hypothetical protein
MVRPRFLRIYASSACQQRPPLAFTCILLPIQHKRHFIRQATWRQGLVDISAKHKAMIVRPHCARERWRDGSNLPVLSLTVQLLCTDVNSPHQTRCNKPYGSYLMLGGVLSAPPIHFRRVSRAKFAALLPDRRQCAQCVIIVVREDTVRENIPAVCTGQPYYDSGCIARPLNRTSVCSGIICCDTRVNVHADFFGVVLLELGRTVWVSKVRYQNYHATMTLDIANAASAVV